MGKKKKSDKLSQPIKEAQREYNRTQNEIPTDVLGSYTGTPLDRVQPEQDVDDL